MDRDNKSAANEKKKDDKTLSQELEQSFPASDPPSSTQPGSGITGAEVRKPKT